MKLIQKRYIIKSLRQRTIDDLKGSRESSQYGRAKCFSVFSPCFFTRLDGSYQGKVEFIVYHCPLVLFDEIH